MKYNYENLKYVDLGHEGQFLVYIPPNVNENTRTFVYSHGSGGSHNTAINGFRDLGNYLEQNGSDSIVVIPTSWAGYTDPRWADKTMNMVESVWNEYGIENRNVDNSGWSGGGQNAFYITLENIKRNSNGDPKSMAPQMIFLLDDHCEDSVTNVIHNRNESILGHGGKETLLENNTIIFSFMSADENSWVVKTKKQVNQIFAQEGLNVIQVKCTDGLHRNINDNFFKNGLIDYTNGTVSLPTEGYIYEMYNTETESWEEIDVSQISTTQQLYELLGIDNFVSLTYAEKIDKLLVLEDISIGSLVGGSYCLRSDYELLEGRLNSIVGKIRNSTVAQETPDFLSFISSTTKVPQQIPSAVFEYFGMSANLLLSLDSDCREFAKVGLSLKQMDDNLEDNASEL